MSGLHAQIIWDGSCWEIHDLGSRNGTFVDGRKLESGEHTPLEKGAEIILEPGPFRALAQRFGESWWQEVMVRQRWQAHQEQEMRGGEVIVAPRGGVELVQIPGGTFLMGSPENEEGRWDDEGPQHEVPLESFYLARTPVTNVQVGGTLTADRGAVGVCVSSGDDDAVLLGEQRGRPEEGGVVRGELGRPTAHGRRAGVQRVGAVRHARCRHR